MRMGKLVEETGFAHARFAHYCNNLSMTVKRLLKRTSKLLHFCVTPNEPGESPHGRRL